MQRITLSLITSIAVVLVFSDAPTQAQAPIPYSRPAFSPYLNLLRQGNPLFQNYYGLVRPQIEFNNDIQRLQQQVTANQQAIQSDEGNVNPNLPATGHGFGYMNHRSFFLNNTSGGASRNPGSRPNVTQQSQPTAPRPRAATAIPRGY